jgi:hypothetical protein
LKSFVNMSLDSYFTLFLSKSLFLAFNIVMAFAWAKDRKRGLSPQ